MHSLAALLPHYDALRVSKPEEWGLAGKENNEKAYVQCLDPASYTDGGTVIFEISKLKRLTAALNHCNAPDQLKPVASASR